MIQLLEVFSASWRQLKPHLLILAGLLIGFTIISALLSLAFSPLESTWLGKGFSIFLSLIINTLFSLGYLKNLFQALDDIEPQFSAYKMSLRQIINYLLANIIMSLLIVLGLCLLILPGIYIALRLQFAAALIVEKDVSAIDALTQSWEITQGHTMQLFLLLLLMVGILILGLILFLIGLFFATPLVYMMYCYLFRKLMAMHEPPSFQNC
jgi:hypothetical protein